MRKRLLGAAVTSLVLIAIGGPAMADNPGSSQTTTDQALNVQINSPSNNAVLPQGTTSTNVQGAASLGAPPSAEAHVAFVVDASGSLGTGNFDVEKQAVQALYNNMEAVPYLTLWAGLIRFATTVDVISAETTDSNQFLGALNAMAYTTGYTHTLDALTAADTMLKADSGTKQIVLLTDGLANPTSQIPTSIGPTLQADGIDLYSYVVGSSANCGQLDPISVRCVHVQNFSDLTSTVAGATTAGIQGVTVAVNGGNAVPATIGSLGSFSADVDGLQTGANTIVATVTADDGTTATADVTVYVARAQTAADFVGDSYTYGDDPVTLPAATDAPDGSPLSYTSQTPSVCTVGGDPAAVSFVGTGTCTLEGTAASPGIGVLAYDATDSASVVPATLTITASGGSFGYGGTPPTIEPQYSGFVNGEDASVLTTAPTCSTDATSSSAPGDYTSSCTGAAAANYTISYVDGVVTVTKGHLNVTTSSNSTFEMLFDHFHYTVTSTVTSVETGDPVAGVEVDVTVPGTNFSCTGVTDASGVATCQNTGRFVFARPTDYIASVAETASYLAASGDGTISMF